MSLRRRIGMTSSTRRRRILRDLPPNQRRAGRYCPTMSFSAVRCGWTKMSVQRPGTFTAGRVASDSPGASATVTASSANQKKLCGPIERKYEPSPTTREPALAEEFNRLRARVGPERKIDALGEARQVHDDEDALTFVFANEARARDGCRYRRMSSCRGRTPYGACAGR